MTPPGFAAAFAFIIGTAFAVLVGGFLLSPPPAEAAHCDNDVTSTTPVCEPGHVVVDNFPTEYPSVTRVENVEVAPTECDQYAGMRRIDNADGTHVCVLEVRVPVDPDWQQAGLFGGFALIAGVSALVVTQVGRR